jgi:ribosomal protein S18 acetylase RimI-like enzyme
MSTAANLVSSVQLGILASMTEPTIRPQRQADQANLHRAFIELQEVERSFHDSRRRGGDIAKPYFDWMQEQVADRNGAVFVAEANGVFQGFVACWVERNSHIIETPDSNVFGLISDICVMPEWRGRGIATSLLSTAEAHLASQGVVRVRIGALAMNEPAISAYLKQGFAPYEILLEKRVEPAKTRL